MNKNSGLLVLTAFVAVIPLLAGCSEQIRSQYTFKNMVVGGCIGLIVAVVAGLLTKKKDRDKNEDGDKE